MFARDDNRNIPVESRAAIIALWQEGLSQQVIGDKLGVSRWTVKRWIQRYEETGGVERQKGSGSKRKTTPEEDHRLTRVARENRFEPALKLAGKLICLLLCDKVLIVTVKNWRSWRFPETLCSGGLRSRKFILTLPRGRIF
jgi:transposase-like protein